MVAEPGVTAVTGTNTVVVFAPNTTVCGTVATPGLLDVSVTSTPFCGAGPDSVSAIIVVSVPVVASVGEAKLYPNPTRTDTRLVLRPTADADTVTDPAPRPLTRACEFGVVCPSLKITFCNERLTLVGSLLMSSTKVTPCDGRLKVTGNAACSPSATTRLIGRLMSGGLNVMLAVVSANSAALARIVAEPGAMPVTVTLADVALAAIVTLDGTVATAVFVELNVIVVPPTGAGPDIVSVNVRVPTSINVTLDGEKLIVAVTRAVCEAGAYPTAAAVIVTVPRSNPEIAGGTTGLVAPAGINTLAGTLSRAGMLLVSRTVVPPAGAATERLTGRADCVPKTNATTGSTTLPRLATVIVTFTAALLLMPSLTTSCTT